MRSLDFCELIGTVRAEVSEEANDITSDKLEGIAKLCKIDTSRFKTIGISIEGIENQELSLICIDHERSNEENNHVVKVNINKIDNRKVVSTLFNKMHITLYDRFDIKNRKIEYNEIKALEEIS